MFGSPNSPLIVINSPPKSTDSDPFLVFVDADAEGEGESCIEVSGVNPSTSMGVLYVDGSLFRSSCAKIN